MIEDESLSIAMVRALGEYVRQNRRGVSCHYKTSLWAYPNEKFAKVKFTINDYPQGWEYEITTDFKNLTKRFFENRYPNWTYEISIV